MRTLIPASTSGGRELGEEVLGTRDVHLRVVRIAIEISVVDMVVGTMFVCPGIASFLDPRVSTP